MPADDPLRVKALRFLVRRSFPLWQRLGLHVTLNHYYWPVPDTRELPADFFTRESEMPGVELNPVQQLKLVETFRALEGSFDRFRQRGPAPHDFWVGNDTFGPVDAEALHGMIRTFKPRRILEVGSGNSTFLAAAAASTNTTEGSPSEVVSIEPYPWPVLQKGFPGLSRLIAKKIQDVPMEEFQALRANDILFLDSSHVLKMGSDVQFELLEVLPRLARGVLVHFHDIFLPGEYPREWVMRDKRFWNEQHALQAFLCFNAAWEVLWAGNWLHRRHPDKLRAAFRSYDPSRPPGSFWIRRVS